MTTSSSRIQTVTHEGEIIAIVVYGDHAVSGIEFVAPQTFSLQLGLMRRPAGYSVVPHVHYPVRRQTIGTQEVLFVKSGVIRVDLYAPDQRLLESCRLVAGDIILLAGGGHGVEFLEEATIVEVKNGPYAEGADKGRFTAAGGA